MAKAIETQRKKQGARTCICVFGGGGRTDAISNSVFEAFGRPNVGRCICIVGVWAGADAISISACEAFGRPNVRTCMCVSWGAGAPGPMKYANLYLKRSDVRTSEQKTDFSI